MHENEVVRNGVLFIRLRGTNFPHLAISIAAQTVKARRYRQLHKLHLENPH